MLVSLTVGKVDAGVAVLLTEDKRLIEFPSILLPSTIQSGSIVDITVSQNHAAEEKAQQQFTSLQSRILDTYGLKAPSAPVLRLRNATQTSLVLEWDPIELATSTLRSLALYRNGSKAGNIPRPHDMHATKISGLPLNTEFSFYLVLRTSGGTFTSNTVVVRTHEMTNLTGICVTPGVLPGQLRDSLDAAVDRIGAKISETVQIHTTHFVCTEPRGTEWQKAVDGNIPIVRPEWVEGCEREGKIVGVRDYYLDADPSKRVIGRNPSMSANTGVVAGQAQQRGAGAQQMAARTGTGAQGNLPSRGQPMPMSPREDEGEPGPEVKENPTPVVPQKELPPHPPANDDEDEEEEADGDDDEEPDRRIGASSRDPEADDDEDGEENKHDSRMADRLEASAEDSKAEDLEDVAL